MTTKPHPLAAPIIDRDLRRAGFRTWHEARRVVIRHARGALHRAGFQWPTDVQRAVLRTKSKYLRIEHFNARRATHA